MNRIREQNEKIKQRRLVWDAASWSLAKCSSFLRMSKQMRRPSKRRRRSNALGKLRREECKKVSTAPENRMHGAKWTKSSIESGIQGRKG